MTIQASAPVSKPVTVAAQPADLSALRLVWREHAVLISVLLAYVVVGGLVLRLLGRPWPLKPYYPLVLWAFALGSALYLAHAWVRHPARLRAALAPQRILSAVLVALLITPTQITSQALKQSIGPIRGFPWDALLSRADIWLHGGLPAWRWTTPIVEAPFLRLATDHLYLFWFPVLMLWVTWIAWTSHRELRRRALLAMAGVWILGGTMTAWVFASAGPCYLNDPAYAPLIETLRTDPHLTVGRVQVNLWRLMEANVWMPVGGISAFPSMHVAAVVLIAITVWARSRTVGTVAWLYVILVQIGSVVLGWHYAIDGYAGALIAWGCWRGSDTKPVSPSVTRWE